MLFVLGFPLTAVLSLGRDKLIPGLGLHVQFTHVFMCDVLAGTEAGQVGGTTHPSLN